MEELGLSLGLKPLSFVEKSYEKTKDLGLCMGAGKLSNDDGNDNGNRNGVTNNSDRGPPVQLQLLPSFSPVHHHLHPNSYNNFPNWLNNKCMSTINYLIFLFYIFSSFCLEVKLCYKLEK